MKACTALASSLSRERKVWKSLLQCIATEAKFSMINSLQLPYLHHAKRKTCLESFYCC